MTRRRRPDLLRTLGLVLLASAALAMVRAPAASAAFDPAARARASSARLLAPAPGEKVVESAARFAFDLPKGALAPRLVISRQAFDPSGWTALPGDASFTLLDASRGAASLARAALSLEADTPLWWCVAWRDPRTGTLRASEAREFTALRKFQNRVAPAPWLPEARRGTLAPEVVAPRRAAAARGETAARPPIRLEAGYTVVPGGPAPAVPPSLSRAATSPGDGADPVRSWLVQFADPPGPAELDAVSRAGGAVVAYLPEQAYLVRMTGAAAERLLLSRGDAWTTEFLPAYKVSPLADLASPGAAEFHALLFADADLERARRDLTGLGANGLRISDNGVNRIARFSLERNAVPAVASLGSVEWVEPVAHFTLDNDKAQYVVQTGASGNRRVWDQGIRGLGQVVMTSDSGILTDHDMFRDPAVSITGFGDYTNHRKIIAYRLGSTDPNVAFGDHSGASWHGTHTAGTLCGNDSINGNGSLRDGMAKDAKMFFMDVSGPAIGNGVVPFDDLNDLFLPPYQGNSAGAARISSNSWGSAVAGAYDLYALEVDQFMWAHPDFYIAFANGNSGAVGTVSSPATAKSVAGIGGTGNGTSENLIYGSTSKGPTQDGRRKPTYCAPGASVTSSVGPSTSNYGTLSGTSMASPAATGAVTLMRQYLTDGWYPTGAPVPGNGFSPSAALLKAMAVNSGANAITGYNAPDNNIGWGRITADSVLFFPGDARKLMLVDFTEGLGQGEYVEYQVNVADGAVPLKVSLCWTDFPGSPAAARELVNDLDLTVLKDATIYRGNVFSNGTSATGGTYDSLNVEEGVRVGAPATGLWTVRVSAKAVPVGPQPFALVVTGGLGAGAGTLALDRALYGPADTLEIRVTDSDATSPLTVSVSSATESAPESVTLTGANGIFEGAIPLTTLPASNGDGALSVSNGDGISASYSDLSPAATLSALASVNFDTPVVTNVRATSQGYSGTLVTWDTDRNASSRVHWGETAALELGPTDSLGYTLHHAVLLTGLGAGQSYLFDVESTGLAGGSARDDLGGAHHRFTAKDHGDVLLVLGDPNFARLSTWTTSLGALGYDYDLWSGPSADHPAVGGAASGLRSYKAVLWQAGPDDYPAFTQEQRDAVDSLLAGGGRLAVSGHDIGWGLADPSSPGYSLAAKSWLEGTLKAKFKSDPVTWDHEIGNAGDPISGAWTGAGLLYEPLGNGLAGDEVGLMPDAGPTGAMVWMDNETSPDTTGLRWESPSVRGSAANAFWGGQKSRLVDMFFEWTGLRPPPAAPDATRDATLGNTVTWLLGRALPTVAITSPVGGENITTYLSTITWNESVAPGRAVANRTLELSLDGGDSWTTIATGVGPSPHSWDISAIPNSPSARVRIRVTDDGVPALSALDASNADFTLSRPTLDSRGPIVVAGSIQCAPNPVLTGAPAALLARVTDAQTGGGTISAAEWSVGDSPAVAGHGYPMSSTFDSMAVNVTAALNTNILFTGTRKIWVRGRDASNHWGAASSLAVRVNGTDPVGVEEQPGVSFLAQNAPNPFSSATEIRFGLARAGEVELVVFDLQGRTVRTVARGSFGAGLHHVRWDGRDESGARVAAGIYWARLRAPELTVARRMVRLD